MNPISSHPISLAQFVQPSPKIIAPQTIIPKVETSPTAGTLNSLLISGCFFLMIQTPAHTRIKANKVPMLVISPTISPGIKDAKQPTNTKNIRFDLYGVLNLGCILENTFGTNPSLLIE